MKATFKLSFKGLSELQTFLSNNEPWFEEVGIRYIKDPLRGFVYGATGQGVMPAPTWEVTVEVRNSNKIKSMLSI